MASYSSRLKNRASSAMTRDRARGAEAEDEFYRRSTEFDPREYARDTATGLFDQFEETTGRGIRDIRSQLAGTGGRLMSGYGQESEDEFVGASRRDLNSRIAQLGMQSAQLDLSNTGAIGSYGLGTTNRFVDMLSGERDREQMAEEARRQRKGGLLGAVGGIVGGVAGTVLGPAGTAIGGRLGSWAAGKVGG